MWQKKVKAGVMLYALFMAAIFSLLLQFYLNRQVNNQRTLLRHEVELQAYAMALLTKETITDSTGYMEFQQGKTQYQKEKEQVKVQVQLEGHAYQFQFSVNGKKD